MALPSRPSRAPTPRSSYAATARASERASSGSTPWRARRVARRRAGRRITLPCLLAGYDGDNSIFPEDQDAIAASLGSADLTRVEVPGDHYGFPAERGRAAAAATLVDWLNR